jgi:hypothetical protein
MHRKTGQYWRVDYTQTNSVESVEAEYKEEQKDGEQLIQLEEEEGCCNLDLAELLCIEEEEEHQLANEAHANVCLPDKLLHDKNTRWLHECRWPR